MSDFTNEQMTKALEMLRDQRPAKQWEPLLLAAQPLDGRCRWSPRLPVPLWQVEQR
jgi:hypothetical protein